MGRLSGVPATLPFWVDENCSLFDHRGFNWCQPCGNLGHQQIAESPLPPCSTERSSYFPNEGYVGHYGAAIELGRSVITVLFQPDGPGVSVDKDWDGPEGEIEWGAVTPRRLPQQ